MNKLLILIVAFVAQLSAMAATTDTLRVHIDDMHCLNCFKRIKATLKPMQGVDSVMVRLPKHCVTVVFDANVISADTLKAAISKQGFTPVHQLIDADVAYAYFIIPQESATKVTMDKVRTISAVTDVNVSERKKALAVAYQSSKLTEEQLLEAVRKCGIDANIPPKHVCKEKK